MTVQKQLWDEFKKAISETIEMVEDTYHLGNDPVSDEAEKSDATEPDILVINTDADTVVVNHRLDCPDPSFHEPGEDPRVVELTLKLEAAERELADRIDSRTVNACAEAPMNRFAHAKDVTELISQIVGAGSVCFANGEVPNGIFDDALARRITNDGIERLYQIRADIRLQADLL